MSPLEYLLFRSLRRRLYPFLRGRILEVGAGTGVNAPLYAPSVELVATDLSEPMLRQARRRPMRARACWVQADAESLPFAESSFACVAASLVFCSIKNPQIALSEIWRVLQPGGSLVLLEHVRGQDGLARWLTDVLESPWHRFSASCHLNRDSAAAVERAGFRITCAPRYRMGLVQIIMARKPESGAPGPIATAPPRA